VRPAWDLDEARADSIAGSKRSLSRRRLLARVADSGEDRLLVSFDFFVTIMREISQKELQPTL
jgi:hypothetical protein